MWRTNRVALRHMAATWRMHAGQSYDDTGGFQGMDAKTVERVYGHHHHDFQKDVASAY
ncbi:MAG: hypothetical protein AAF441_17515 [Pseudomonadota bacterium]